jgi:hypothetical protein
VDDAKAAETFKLHPEMGPDRRFKDYRVMLDKLGSQIDAVTVSTPDHMHFPIAMAAMSLGKHVFVEKPLTHTISEARTLAKTAREKKVATQMGNQGHAGDGCRTSRSGSMRASSATSPRSTAGPTGRSGRRASSAPDHSKMMPVVPATLDWDLWLGVAAPREYDPAYLPFTWRGLLGLRDGRPRRHGLPHPGRRLLRPDLGSPTHVEAVSARQTEISPPKASMVTYTYPARGSMVPLKLTWYDGGLQPTSSPEPGARQAARPERHPDRRDEGDGPTPTPTTTSVQIIPTRRCSR